MERPPPSDLYFPHTPKTDLKTSIIMAGFVTGADKRLNEALLENLTPAFKEIPVIDISAATSPNKEDRIALAKTIRKACETIGFFYVSNHGTYN